MRTLLIFLLCMLLSVLCIRLKAQTNDSIKTQQLSEVEISGKKAPSISRSTTPLQVMTSKTITEQGLQSVSDVVRRFSGVVLKDYGGIGGLKTVAVRGMGAEHTAVSYDGIMVSNVLSGQIDLSRFSLDNVETVTLSISQSDNIFQTAKAFASAGVLNLQTLTPDFLDKDYKGKVRVTSGSFGLLNPVVDYSRKLNDVFAMSVNGSWQRADGNYRFKQENDKLLPDRKRYNSDIDVYRTEFNLFSNLGNAGNLNTKLYYFDSDRGLPGNVTLGNDYAAERLLDRNFFAQVGYNNTFGENLKFRSQAKYDYVYTRYRIDELSETKINRYRQQEIYWSNALLYSPTNSLSFSFAEDLSFNKLNNEMATFADNLPYPKRYNSLSAIAAQYNSRQLTITANVLGTYINEKIKSGSDNTYKKISPTISLSYKPFNTTDLRIRASFKQLFRVPTFTELYYSSISKKLNPELAKQYNLGLTWVGAVPSASVNYISAGIDVYYNDVKDKIIIIPYPFMASSTNLGKVEIIGADVKVATNISVGKGLDIDISGLYSYMQARDMTDRDNAKTYKMQIQYTPKHSGSATVSFNNPWVNLSYSVIAAGKRYFNIQNIDDNKVDAYTDHSISLYKKMKVKRYDLYLQGNLLNLFNKNYDVIAYYPMPGRSFKITAGFIF